MIDDKFWHIKNVASSMRVTLKGMLIDFIAVCANANIPIFSNVLGQRNRFSNLCTSVKNFPTDFFTIFGQYD